MQMQMPAEHPQYLGYGGLVYDGARGYAPGGYGQVYEGEYWDEPEQAFADGGAISANTDYGYHGNQMSLSQPMAYMVEGGNQMSQPMAYRAEGGNRMSQPTAYMAEGGEANSTENTSNLWRGANTRSMFGYDSKAAQQGKKMQQAAMNNRARLSQNLQQQIAAKEWQNVEPNWQPWLRSDEFRY